jgi:hypothetical protein
MFRWFDRLDSCSMRCASRIGFCMIGLSAGLMWLNVPVLAQNPPQASASRGTSQAAPRGLTSLETTRPILPQDIARTPIAKPLLSGLDPVTYSYRKAQASSMRFETDGAFIAPPVVQSSANRTPGAAVGFVSTGEVACGNVTPADQAIGVGDTPVGVLQVINVCVNVYDKSGNLQAGYPKSATSFFGLPAGTPFADPRVIYDWVNHRYVVAMISFDPNFNSASNYHIAVSTGDNPAGGYCIYTIGVQSVASAGPGTFPLPDFPRLGQDQQAFYLASNIFNPNYKWEEILVLPKAQMYACQGFGFSFFNNLTFGGVVTDTTQPANIFNPSDNPRSEYLVTSKNINFSDPKNGLVVWAIHSPLSSPTLTGVGVGTANNYSFPPGASQTGSANSIDSGDNRISGMVFYAAGSLYASVTSNGGAGQPDCILYQIQPFITASSTGTDGQINSARILNEIVLGGGANSWYYCTQLPDPGGNSTTVFNFSGNSNFASLAYISRRAAQPIGGFEDSGVFLINGQALYNQGRWGDYTAGNIAGLVSGGGTGSLPVMWFAGMYARSDATWGTAVGRNGYQFITDK